MATSGGGSRPRSVVLIIVSIASNIRFDTYEDTPLIIAEQMNKKVPS